MTALLIGPILRHVGSDEATVWMETDAAGEVEVLGCRAATFSVQGHHFALVTLRDLDPGRAYPYEVRFEGVLCWPPAGQRQSVIRTFAPDQAAVSVVAGSCRRAAPEVPPWTSSIDDDPDALGADALALLARRLLAGDDRLPDLLVMGGDQVYSDLPSPATLAFIRSRRAIVGDHDAETIDFEEYAFSYREAWTDPAVRWLLSTVPTAMIFDDHDVHNGWNASSDWVEEMAVEPGWPERVKAGLVAYWVYQHLGNLSCEALADDEVWQAVCAGDDVDAAVEDVAARTAQLGPGGHVRWSYRWDAGAVRMVVIDSRSARLLVEGQRDMLPPSEWDWVEANLTGGATQLLVVTSVPVLLPRMVHHLETWSERAAAGAWGRIGVMAARQGRHRLGLEHWPAYQSAFAHLMNLVTDVAAGRRGPAPGSVVLLSGEVHYSYVAEVVDGGGAPVVQIVSSPLRNPTGRRLRALHRCSMTSVAAVAARALAMSARVRRPLWKWRVSGGPWFANGLVSLHFVDRDVVVRFESTAATGTALDTVDERRIGVGA